MSGLTVCILELRNFVLVAGLQPPCRRAIACRFCQACDDRMLPRCAAPRGYSKNLFSSPPLCAASCRSKSSAAQTFRRRARWRNASRSYYSTVDSAVGTYPGVPRTGRANSVDRRRLRTCRAHRRARAGDFDRAGVCLPRLGRGTDPRHTFDPTPSVRSRSADDKDARPHKDFAPPQHVPPASADCSGCVLRGEWSHLQFRFLVRDPAAVRDVLDQLCRQWDPGHDCVMSMNWCSTAAKFNGSCDRS